MRRFFYFAIGTALVFLSRVRAEPGEAVKLSARDLAHELNAAYEQVYESVAPAVVVIDLSRVERSAENNPLEGFDFFFHGRKGDGGSEPSDQSEGSGFLIREDGYILTNNHVIADGNKIDVKLKDGRTFPARVVGTDERTDVAVIKVDGSHFPVVTFADSDQVKVGELVCAIGAPYKFDYTFTTGVVSAKGRNELLADKYEDYVQTDAAINPGNSGGPLCDIDGQVIGINTLIHGLNRGLGFAISSNLARQVSEQLIANGRIVRPWLGIMIETLNGQNKAEAKGVDKGVIVRTIQAEAPAEKSDLHPADVITEVDAVAVNSARDLQREILKKKVGDEVVLGVWRDGKKLNIPVKTEEIPSEQKQAATGESPAPGNADAAAEYGLEVRDVTPALRQTFGLQAETGVVVTEVAPNSAAANADVQQGDLIAEVGRNPVNDAQLFERALQEQKGKTAVLLLLDRKGVKTYSILKLPR